ncbi:hypothetical protein LSAT2_019278 [Lamellibrachia satsuma]|nr:hypothetical protein LSAT2_019278 [Lamellibrachia satsuma]
MEAETDVEEGAEVCHDDGVKTQDRPAKTRNSYVLESQKAPDKKPNHGNHGGHSLCGSGALEKWPAHASMPDPCPGNVVLNKKGNIVLARPDAASSACKPKFLEQLETFLYRELLYLGVSEMKPSELRMQASRPFSHGCTCVNVRNTDQN